MDFNRKLICSAMSAQPSKTSSSKRLFVCSVPKQKTPFPQPVSKIHKVKKLMLHRLILLRNWTEIFFANLINIYIGKSNQMRSHAQKFEFLIQKESKKYFKQKLTKLLKAKFFHLMILRKEISIILLVLGAVGIFLQPS